MSQNIENRIRVAIADIFEIADQVQDKPLAESTAKMFNTFTKEVLPKLSKANAKLAVDDTIDKDSQIKGKVIQYRKRA